MILKRFICLLLTLSFCFSALLTGCVKKGVTAPPSESASADATPSFESQSVPSLTEEPVNSGLSDGFDSNTFESVDPPEPSEDESDESPEDRYEGIDEEDYPLFDLLMDAYEKTAKAHHGKASYLMNYTHDLQADGKQSDSKRSELSFATDEQGNFLAFGRHEDGGTEEERFCYNNRMYFRHLSEHEMYDRPEYTLERGKKNHTVETAFWKDCFYDVSFREFTKYLLKKELTVKTEEAQSEISFSGTYFELMELFWADGYQDIASELEFYMGAYSQTHGEIKLTVKNGYLSAVCWKEGGQGQDESYESSEEICFEDLDVVFELSLPEWCVDVIPDKSGRAPVIWLQDYEFIADVGDIVFLKEYVTVDYADKVTFHSAEEGFKSDARNIEVSEDGTVRCLAPAPAVVYVVAENEYGKTVNVLSIMIFDEEGILETVTPVFKSKLTGNLLTLDVGEQISLWECFSVKNASGVYYSFENTTSDIIEVDRYGTVSALFEGYATIVIHPFGSPVQMKISVTVQDSTPPDQSKPKILYQSMPMADGTSIGTTTTSSGFRSDLNKSISQRHITFLYADTITFTSTDTKVLAIDENGIAYAVGVGKADVVITASNKFGKTSIYISYTVNGTSSRPIKLLYKPYSNAQYSIEESSAQMDLPLHSYDSLWERLGSTLAFSSTTFHSSDPSVVSVTEYGRIYAVSKGSATVTATIKNGIESKVFTLYVTVDEHKPYAEIEIYHDVLLFVGEKYDFSGKVNIDHAESVRYSSSDEKVGIVDANCMITGVSQGKITVSLTAENQYGTTVKTFTVYVTEKNSAPILDVINPVVYAYEEDLIYRNEYINCYRYDSLSLSFSDESVAIGMYYGEIKCLKAGTVTVTVTATNEYGSTVKTIQLVVEEWMSPPIVEIPDEHVEIDVGQWYNVELSWTLKYAREVSVVSSDESIAWIDVFDNCIQGERAGTVTVTVTATNEYGSIVKEFTLTVIAHEEPPTMDIEDGEVFYAEVGAEYLIYDFVYFEYEEFITLSISDESIVESIEETIPILLVCHKEGTVTVTVTATNQYGSTTKYFTLNVSA